MAEVPITLLRALIADISSITGQDPERAYFELLGAFCAETLPLLANRDLNEALCTSVFGAGCSSVALELAKKRRIDLATADCRLFGYLHEGMRAKHELKRKGIFYTPAAIAASITRRALEGVSSSAPHRSIYVLDPACGCGTFLIEAFEQIYREHPAIDPQAVLKQCLYGVDIDPSAVAICRVLLQISFLRLTGSREIPAVTSSIRHGNALIDPSSLCGRTDASIAAFSFNEMFPDVMSEGGFHCIIGNPPYGLARGEQLSVCENEIVKERFAHLRNGKVNKYMLFMGLAMELLREGGRCSFIVPNSWLGIAAALKLRGMLFAEGALEEIEILNFPAFNEPSVETVIFTAQKKAHRDSIRIRHTQSHEELGNSASIHVSVADCKLTPGQTIPVRWNSAAHNLLGAVKDLCIPLWKMKDRLIPLIALQAYRTGGGTPPQTVSDVRDHVFHRRSKESDDCQPYLEGSDVARYRLGWSGSYLRYGPWLAEHPPLSRFSGPRILIREILARPPYLLSCAYAEHLAVYNRSILHIICGPNGTKRDIYALLALLNSSLASELILLLGQKAQRKLFPKVVNADLLNFPLPRDWERFVESAAPMAQERLQLMSEDACRALDKAIDEIVAAHFKYELTASGCRELVCPA